MHSVSCTTHHEVTDLVNHVMVILSSSRFSKSCHLENRTLLFYEIRNS